MSENKEFKPNEKYDYNKKYINERLNIDKERRYFLLDSVPENLDESEFLDFVEQQNWTTIEKLYVVYHFIRLSYEE